MNAWGLHLNDWLNLLVRWTHLIAGIAWIGSSFYFMWLDAHLAPPERSKKDVEGELWMVHSGGFYLVERKKIAPGMMPKVLHWFKYEALLTWVSGVFLLGLIYYFTDGAYLVDPAVMPLRPAVATGISIAILVSSWLVYDSLWQSWIGKKHPQAATGISLFLASSAAFGFCHYLSGRAAFIHVGAMFGTIMVANVWVRILPSQQKMIDATQEGRAPDYSLSDQAKRRSVHNSYMTFPVLLMMLSNHYATAYGHQRNGIVLFLLILFGASVRHIMIAKGNSGKWAFIPAGVSLVSLVSLTASMSSPTLADLPTDAALKRVSFNEVKDVVSRRCVNCHSQSPVDRTFGASPGGVSFEAPERIKALASRIKFRAVETKTMPLANKTGITDVERSLLGRWVDEGAVVND